MYNNNGDYMKYKYLDNKRYYTLNQKLQEKFKTRVFKVSLNGGFSCPNFKNGHGCVFCSALGSGDFAGDKKEDLLTQFNTIKDKLNQKWPDTKYIAYFQANTNTYAPVKILKEKFEKVLTFPNVVGINIGTRPDAITEECLEYLSDLNKRTYLTIELGLQSMHNDTLKLINRGHDLECFDTCAKRLREKNINVVVHIINGLPGETKKMMLDTVKHLNKLDIQGIKIHMLHILKNTPLEEYYKEKKFHILSKEEYVDIVCDQLELLNENIVIHRLTGDGKKEDLIAPLWILKKVDVLNAIDKELKRRNTFQGFKKDFFNQILLIKEKMFKEKDYVYLDTFKEKITTLFSKNKLNRFSNLENYKNKISLAIIDDDKIKDIKKIEPLLNKKGTILIISNKKLKINSYPSTIYESENGLIYEIRKEELV